MHHSCEMKNQFSAILHKCGRRVSAVGLEWSWGRRRRAKELRPSCQAGACTHVDFFQAPARPIIPLISDTTDDISISAFPVLAGVASCREVNAHAHTTWVVQIPYITRWRKSARAFASTTSANPRQCE